MKKDEIQVYGGYHDRLERIFNFVDRFSWQSREAKMSEKPRNLARAFELLTQLPDDFFADGRKDSSPQERDF